MKFFLFFSVVFLFSTGCSNPSTEVPIRPNILFILADDLGIGELGCYGQPDIKTPKIDQLAAEGIRFTQHYAGTSVCAPSRCVIMTGLHTGHAPIRGNQQAEPYGQRPLPDRSITIAEVLKSSGYSTALFGKWGLGVENSSGDPNQQGFDEFYGYYCQVLAHNAFPEFLMRNGQKEMLSNKVTYMPEDHWTRGLGSYATEKNEYANDLMVQEALNYMDTHGNNPFFIFLSLTMPHNNGEAPEGQKFESPGYSIYKLKDWDHEKKSYAASITRMDGYIGMILDKLKETGLDRNTLILFSSDNGPEAGADMFFKGSGIYRGHKRDLYEGGIRVPMIAWWPEKIRPGKISDHVSGFWDLLPTFCELSGATAPNPIDGISFVPELLGKKQADHEYLYWEFHEQGKKQAVRKGNWKGVKLNVYDSANAPLELYDLEIDPGEQKNLAGEFPEVADELDALLKEAHVKDDVWPLFRSENMDK